MTAQIYVGTYKKYNDGNLFGDWLQLENYTDRDDFYNACAKLHADEDDPEFMFQDWEGIPSSMISENHIEGEVWSYLEAAHRLGEEPVEAYCECFGKWSEGGFEDRYHGEYSSWESMAEELLDETGELDSIPEHLRYYFDFEAYARDIRCSGDMCEHNGHFFWNH